MSINTQRANFTLGSSLFGDAKLNENANLDQYECSGYSIGFDARVVFRYQMIEDLENVLIFGVDMSSSLHIDNKKKDILIIGKGPKDRLDDTTLTAEKDYVIILLSNKINFV